MVNFERMLVHIHTCVYGEADRPYWCDSLLEDGNLTLRGGFLHGRYYRTEAILQVVKCLECVTDQISFGTLGFRE